MKIVIHGKNLELTGALKEYTEAKIEKATHHYKDIVKEADIHLSIEKNPRVSFQTAEVTIFANGIVIRSSTQRITELMLTYPNKIRVRVI